MFLHNLTMKKVVLIFAVFIFGVYPSFGYVREYFNDFYDLYLYLRSAPSKERQVLDFLHEISDSKLESIENFLNNAKNKEDIETALVLIDDEYQDFLENLNFELNYLNCSPVNKRCQKKLKNAHKKFMRTLQNDYLSSKKDCR